MTATRNVWSLSEPESWPTTCPECDSKTVEETSAESGSLEFYCGSFIDHNPRRDPSGFVSFQEECLND